MTRLLVAMCALVLVTGCTASSSGDQSRESSSGRVDVDTAALRHARSAAGVEPCRPGPGTSSSELPRTTLPCLGGGRSVDLHRLQGPLVINLFAQWCGPCRGELPYYQQLHRKARGQVRVLGVDYLDTQPGAALDLVKDAGVTYPLLADPAGDLREPFRVRGLPGVVLVDADGKVTVQFRVFRSYADLRDLVQQQLHVRVPA